MRVTTIPRTLGSCHESLGHEQMYHDSCNYAAALLFTYYFSKHLAERKQPHVEDGTMCAVRGLFPFSLRERVG
jgi:hypothetical protein